MSVAPRDPAEKELWRAQRREVRRALLEDWDPIGVNGVPEASDEYDAYADKVTSMLRDNVSSEEIRDYLRWVATEYMGLSGHENATYSGLLDRLRRIGVGD